MVQISPGCVSALIALLVLTKFGARILTGNRDGARDEAADHDSTISRINHVNLGVDTPRDRGERNGYLSIEEAF